MSGGRGKFQGSGVRGKFEGSGGRGKLQGPDSRGQFRCRGGQGVGGRTWTGSPANGPTSNVP